MNPPPDPRTIKTNAGWCWYQDDRVIVDPDARRVVFTTVANFRGEDGDRRDGDIEISSFDPATGEVVSAVLAKLLTKDLSRVHGHGDDHNAAALWQRPDGRYLAVYTGHNYGMGNHGTDTSPDTFYRVSTSPHDASEWQDERIFTWPSNDPVGDGRHIVTYSNLLHLSAEGGEKGRLYNIARASGSVWQIATSDDWGETWTYRGILSLPPEGGRKYSNGYMKFTGNGVDRIDFITTEAHPRNFNNGIYHGYIKGGKTHDAAGRVVDEDTFSQTGPVPEALTTIFEPQAVGPDSYHHAWTIDLDRGDNGELYALYQTRFGTGRAPVHQAFAQEGNADHRLFFARFDGSQWHSVELARMGHGLWDNEDDYTGLGVLDPADGQSVYVSTPIDPRTGGELAHYEIFLGRAQHDHAIWTWTPVTMDSGCDQLRPQLALLDPEHAILLWLRGSYDSQHAYDQRVVAKVVERM